MFADASEFFSFAVTFYNCSVGHTDCSRCQTADSKYNCVWCGGENPSCIFRGSCKGEIEDLCPAPLIHSVSNLLVYCTRGKVGSILHLKSKGCELRV